LRSQRPPVPKIADPVAAVIFCTADPQKIDYRVLSKWSRVLRYAAVFKDLDEPWLISSSGVAVSINARLDIPVALGEAAIQVIKWPLIHVCFRG
jgi:hypothetical protein